MCSNRDSLRVWYFWRFSIETYKNFINRVPDVKRLENSWEIKLVDILIRNGYVITMNPDRKVIENGAIAVEDNRIVDVGRSEALKKEYEAEIVIDARHKAVLPGFVNTHTHLFQTLMKSLGDDLKLFDWWPEVIGPLSTNLKREHCYYAALLGCLELIRSGCTCTLDNHYPLPVAGLADECVKAFLDIGIRGIEAMGTIDTDKPYFPIPKMLIRDTEEALKDNVRLLRRWHGKDNGRIHIWFGTGASFICSDEILERAYDLSLKYRVGVTCHLHETRDEIYYWKKETGLTPIQYYHKKIRFLGSNLVAVHCVWLDDKDIKILKETNTKVSYNPISNMYLASGISPVSKMLKAGITVSLGVDGAASNNNQDMFELIKMAALLQKVATCDPTSISAEKALEMATIDGAKSLGLESEIGSLEPGKKADIILVDLKQTNMTPLNRVPSQLVYCGKGANVDTVIIDGKVVMENKKIKTVDEEEVIKNAQRAADDLIRRSGMEKWRKRSWTSLPYSK